MSIIAHVTILEEVAERGGCEIVDALKEFKGRLDRMTMVLLGNTLHPYSMEELSDAEGILPHVAPMEEWEVKIVPTWPGLKLSREFYDWSIAGRVTEGVDREIRQWVWQRK